MHDGNVSSCRKNVPGCETKDPHLHAIRYAQLPSGECICTGRSTVKDALALAEDRLPFYLSDHLCLRALALGYGVCPACFKKMDCGDE